MKNIYLDHAATTQIDPRVINEMKSFIETNYGNPSSMHQLGIPNKKMIYQSRKIIADTLGVTPNELYFCSGGTEATNWAIKGFASAHQEKKEIITTKIEHHATLHTCQYMEKKGYKIHYLDVDLDGFIDLKQLENLINKHTLLVSIIWANNEIGTIQNIDEISNICKRKDVVLHVDAVQAFGQVAMNLNHLKIDMLTLSAHKFYGPKGIGCLYVRKGLELDPLIHGGSQEMGLRAGTENLMGIVGMAKAAQLANQELDIYVKHLSTLSNALYHQIKYQYPEVKLNGAPLGPSRMPGHLSFSFKGVSGSLLAFELDKLGVYVSTGSACNAESIEPSHVLKAIQVDKSFIDGTIRVTFGKENEFSDIPLILKKLSDSFDSII